MADIKGAWLIFTDSSAVRWGQVDMVEVVSIENPPDPPTVMTRCLLKSGTAFNVSDGYKEVVDVLMGAGD